MSVPGPPPGAIQPRWGLGEVAAGIVASLLLSLIVGSVVIGITGWTADDVPILGQGLLQLPLWAGYLGAVVYAGHVLGNGVVRDFGLRFRLSDAPLGLVIGILAQVVAVPVLYIPILMLTGADSEDLSAPAERLAERAGSGAGWIVFALIVGVGAPVVEELFYRGLFLRAMTKRGAGTFAAVVITSLVFAGVHLQALQFPGLAMFGVIAALCVVLTDRLGLAIWAHVGFNMTTVVLLYLRS